MTITDIDLDRPYDLDPAAITRFDEQGFVKLKGVLTPEIVEWAEPVITSTLFEHNEMHLPLEERSTYNRAFLQVTDLWRFNREVERFVMAKRFARIAAELLGVDGVRLYHDQGLYKEAGGGITPWHADQYYWPMTSDRVCTMWAPLQATPLEMGPVEFASGSHRVDLGRHLYISDESEAHIQEQLAAADFPVVQEPYELGEVSFHLGWTFHHASPNQSTTPRRVMTVIYMDADMVIAEPTNHAHEAAIARGLVPGEVPRDDVKPLLYRASSAG